MNLVQRTHAGEVTGGTQGTSSPHTHTRLRESRGDKSKRAWVGSKGEESNLAKRELEITQALGPTRLVETLTLA
jgi:hypothetical protein